MGVTSQFECCTLLCVHCKNCHEKGTCSSLDNNLQHPMLSFFTGYSTKHLRRVVEACPQHIDTIMSYFRHNIYDDSLLKDLPFYKSRNIGVINASPLGV